MTCIIFKNTDGTISQTSVAPGVDLVGHAKELAQGRQWHIVARSDLPKVNEFFNAWEVDANGVVTVNLSKGKSIAHKARRAARDEAFAPLDRQATVPTLLKKAEAARNVIRIADAKKQAAIDAAKTEVELLKAHEMVI